MSTIHKSGELRGDKVRYPDGTGCEVWYPIERDGDILEDSGICFSFRARDIPAMLWLLIKLLFAKPDIFEDEDESEEDEGQC